MSETPKCFTKSQPKARKRHRCCECRGWIEPGEKYHVFSGVWDSPGTYKTCADCQALRVIIDAALRKDGDEWSEFTNLSQELDEDQKRQFVAIMEKRCDHIHSSWDKYRTPKP